MRRLIPTLILALLVTLPAGARAGDRLLVGGTVVTPDGERPAQVLIHDDLIAEVRPPTTKQAVPAGTEVTDLHGAYVLPGLCDAHLHLTGYGTALEQVDLVGAASWSEVISRARVAAKELPPGAWLVGRGWDQNLWKSKRFPDRAALDEAFPNRPVLLRRVDGHAAVANAQALRLAGIGWNTPDPAGGRILRRTDGEPNGVLVDTAADLAIDVVPQPTQSDIERRILRAARQLLADGFTEVDDPGTKAEELTVIRRLALQGRLPIRVYVLINGDDETLLKSEFRRGPEIGERRMVRVGGVKLYADGALGSRGALLGSDYSDDPGNHGLPVTGVERLRSVIQRASRAGFQVAVHAIGDEAVHRVLDLYQEVGAPVCRRLRHRIEHSQTIRPADVPRFAALGVIASIQPTHCTSDMPWAPQRLGPVRISWAYRWKSLLDAGVRLCGGSDAPVEDPDPRRGLFAAVTRQRPDHTPPGGWNPAERLTPRQALALFTSGAAFAAKAETWSGAIRPGFVADLTVVDRDPLKGGADQMSRMKVLRTIVAGVDRYVFAGGGAR
ncbi:MAG: amidohydrolase [Acidobacteria bacterium]|nr:amidohydrolase [Acidobacteriota bacterium]